MKVRKPLEKTKEPTWSDSAASNLDLIVALNWYNLEQDSKAARKYLIAYLGDRLSDEQREVAQTFNLAQNISDGWFARCLSRGCIAPDKMLRSFERRIEEFIEELNIKQLNAPAKKQATEVINLQERTQAKADSYIGEMEGDLVDEYGIKGSVENMNAYQWMIDHEIKAAHATRIAEFYQKRFERIEALAKSQNDREYLSGYSKKQLLNLLKCYGNIAQDARKIASNAKIARKPRTKKLVTAEKKVAGLKFKIEDTDFKLKSIDPTNILAATQLWVFNTKTRKLGLYVAANEAGLLVKGSSIENYHTTDSIAKTLRKPKDVLGKVLEGGKITLRKVMGDINSKSSTMNGRINKDTILLRAIKG